MCTTVKQKLDKITLWQRVSPVDDMLCKTMQVAARQSLNKLIIILVVSFVCASLTSCQRNATIRENSGSVPSSNKPTSASGQDTIRAGTSLRKRAAREIDAGHYQLASRLLERALRIDSRDPATYYQFARLRCHEGSPDLALQLIEKGKTLTPDRPLLTMFDQLKESCAQLAVENT